MMFDLIDISEDEVHAALKKMKSKFTSGPDEIPSFFVRDCAPVLSRPLSVPYNMILTSGSVPECWKVSKVVPVFKSGNRSDISNYRPISLINNFSKGLEIIIYNRLNNHLKNTLSLNQHGFVKGRSTVTNLVTLTHNIREELDNRGQMDVVYMDITKAFDQLDHKLLIHKLKHLYGFSLKAIKIFTEYLKDRYQFVECLGYKSAEFGQN